MKLNNCMSLKVPPGKTKIEDSIPVWYSENMDKKRGIINNKINI